MILKVSSNLTNSVILNDLPSVTCKIQVNPGLVVGMLGIDEEAIGRKA